MPPKKPSSKPQTSGEKATGKYVYDKTLKKVVKISDDIPGLKKSSGDGDGTCCPHGKCCGHGACGHG